MTLPPRLQKHSAAVAGSLLFLALGFVLFCSTGHDDSHITYWVAHALQKFGRFVNYNGERIEQSSSVLHVLVLALLGAVTRIPLPTLGPITSILAGVLSVVLTARLAEIVAPNAPRGAAIVAATGASFIYWGFGGLEATLVPAAALWLVLECAGYLAAPERRRLLRAGAAMLVYLLVRPESVVVLACVLAAAFAHALVRRRVAQGSLRPIALLLAVFAVEALLIFAIRRAYFGQFFPNPVYSKSQGIELRRGLEYLGNNVFPWALWLVPGLALGLYQVIRSTLRSREPEFAALLTTAFAVAYLSFIALTGGDWMSGGRFIAHVFPLLVVVTLIGLTRTTANARWQAAVIALLVAANLGDVYKMAAVRSTGRPIWTTSRLRAQLDRRLGDRGYGWFERTNLVHLRDTTVAAALVDVIREIRAKEPDRTLVLMTSQAGMVPYYAFKEHFGALRVVDTCSLATRDFLHCLPASDFDRRGVGMQLQFHRYFGQRERIDAACGSRRPDLVFGLGGRGIEAILQKNGYTIVYAQWGPVRREKKGEGWFTVNLPSDEFIAVDTAIVERVGLTKAAPFVWNIH